MCRWIRALQKTSALSHEVGGISVGGNLRQKEGGADTRIRACWNQKRSRRDEKWGRAS
jgi:hypothetical protein